MSLQKQIQRNMKRNNEKYLAQYQNDLVPNWRALPESQKSLIANLSRNGITLADLEKAKQDGRREAYEDTAPAVMSIAYACMGCVLHDCGVSAEEVKRVIMMVDEKIATVIDNEEVAKELEEKVGLRIYTKEGVGRIETVR